MQTIDYSKKTLFLSGGGNEIQSFLLDNFFFDKIPKNGRFLYIPIALRGNKLYPTSHLWMRSVIDLHKRDDIQFETADDLSKYRLEDLMLFTAVYIGGGNTWNLMQEIKDTKFSDILLKYIEKGGLVYGGSAGAIIMGNRIDTHDDENKINSTDIAGLNSIKDYSITCHFKNDVDNRFSNWSIKNKSPIICLPEDTGLVINGDNALCVGTNPCTIYSPDGTKKLTYPNGSFEL